MKKLIIGGFTLVLALGLGCSLFRAQQVAYTTTDAIGGAVSLAIKNFVDYEIVKARTALGTEGSNGKLVMAWVENDPAWKAYVPLRDQYNAAFNAWCSANAALAGGTNFTSAVASPNFKADCLNAATQLTKFIAQFIPSTKIVQ